MYFSSGYEEVAPQTSLAFGSKAIPLALPFALLQAIKGTTKHNTGDKVYYISDTSRGGTIWRSIWDTCGNETVSAVGVSREVIIDLGDADLSAIDASSENVGDDAFVFNGTTPAAISDAGEIWIVQKNRPGQDKDKTFAMWILMVTVIRK